MFKQLTPECQQFSVLIYAFFTAVHLVIETAKCHDLLKPGPYNLLETSLHVLSYQLVFTVYTTAALWASASLRGHAWHSSKRRQNRRLCSFVPRLFIKFPTVVGSSDEYIEPSPLRRRIEAIREVYISIY